MSKVRILIKLKNGIADPPGQALEKGIVNNFKFDVSRVHLGKVVEFEIGNIAGNIDEMIKKVCDELLVNPVIEEYTYELI